MKQNINVKGISSYIVTTGCNGVTTTRGRSLTRKLQLGPSRSFILFLPQDKTFGQIKKKIIEYVDAKRLRNIRSMMISINKNTKVHQTGSPPVILKAKTIGDGSKNLLSELKG